MLLLGALFALLFGAAPGAELAAPQNASCLDLTLAERGDAALVATALVLEKRHRRLGVPLRVDRRTTDPQVIGLQTSDAETTLALTAPGRFRMAEVVRSGPWPGTPAPDGALIDLDGGEWLLPGPDLDLGSDPVDTAEASFDLNGHRTVAFRVNPAAAAVLAQETSRMASQSPPARVMLIVDDKVLNAPHVMGVVGAGRAMITGNFDENASERLAALLAVGPLEVHITSVSDSAPCGQTARTKRN